jgi:hypothetical protein
MSLPPSNNGSAEGFRELRLTVYRLYRERIVHENNVIDHRLSWMLWSEAIILTLWGSIAAGLLTNTKLDRWTTFLIIILQVVLGIFGLLIGCFSRLGIKAAQTEILRMKATYRGIDEKYDRYERDPVIPELSAKEELAASAQRLVSIIPWSMIVLWSALVLYSVASWFRPFH